MQPKSNFNGFKQPNISSKLYDGFILPRDVIESRAGILFIVMITSRPVDLYKDRAGKSSRSFHRNHLHDSAALPDDISFAHLVGTSGL
jgi:hypothetical protein